MPSHTSSSKAPDNHNVIDGRAIAAQIQRDLAQRVVELNQRGVQPASRSFALAKTRRPRFTSAARRKPALNSAFFSETHVLPEATSESELLALLEKLNADLRLHGILVQAPLPKQIREAIIYSAILPRKDVDGFIRSTSAN